MSSEQTDATTMGICDSCFQSHDITVPMKKAMAACSVVGDGMLTISLGDCYQCGACGRIYSIKAGYFDFRDGDGMSGRQLLPKCNSDQRSIMYLQSGDGERGCGVFVCPDCGQTETLSLEQN